MLLMVRVACATYVPYTTPRGSRFALRVPLTCPIQLPEGPGTQYSRTLVPNTIWGVWLDPLGLGGEDVQDICSSAYTFFKHDVLLL